MGLKLDVFLRSEERQPQRVALNEHLLRLTPEFSADLSELGYRVSRIRRRNPKSLTPRERNYLINAGRALLDFAHPRRMEE